MDSAVVFATWCRCAVLSNDPPESTSPTTSQLVQLVLHSSPPRVLVVYSGPFLFPLEIASSHGLSGPPSNTCFLGLTRVHNSNGMSISSAVFAELTILTDRPCYSVCNNGPHPCNSTAMQPNKYMAVCAVSLVICVLMACKQCQLTISVCCYMPSLNQSAGVCGGCIWKC